MIWYMQLIKFLFKQGLGLNLQKKKTVFFMLLVLFKEIWP
jgi:hypothetical protein